MSVRHPGFPRARSAYISCMSGGSGRDGLWRVTTWPPLCFEAFARGRSRSSSHRNTPGGAETATHTRQTRHAETGLLALLAFLALLRGTTCIRGRRHHLLHHLARFIELLHDLVHFLNRSAGAGRDALAAASGKTHERPTFVASSEPLAMSCRTRAVDTPKICAHSETESMDFPFESPDMNATTIQKPLRYRKGFRSRHALITFNEHVGRFNKEQHSPERKSAGCFPPLNAQPAKCS